MGRTDSLVTGINRASKFIGGSYKTRFNHQAEAKRFVKTLREAGYGVKQWKNITNKHVQQVVNVWIKEGKTVATIKEYLSGVRVVAKYFGNEKISGKNSTFGIPNRLYVTNKDKSLPQNFYLKAVMEFKNSKDIHNNRIAAQLQLQRELGLRKEESFKFNPRTSVLADGRIHISAGTKGGKERIINDISEKAKTAIEYAKSVQDGKDTMSNRYSEKQWNGIFYRVIAEQGITQKNAGASAHGLRHAFAQEKYQKITGFNPPCKFKTKNEFRKNAEIEKGKKWKQLDQDARLILQSELGHGPGRKDVISQYLGSV